MNDTQFDIKRIHELKEIFLRLRQDKGESLQLEIEQYFKHVSTAEVLLIEQILVNGEYGITMQDLQQLSDIYPHLYIKAMDQDIHQDMNHKGHPIRILKEENRALQSCLNQVDYLLNSFEEDQVQFQKTNMVDLLVNQVEQLGEFYKHYHRKEKLIFPIMERYGHFDPGKIMWRGDDRIRALYKGMKKLIDRLPEGDIRHVQTTYNVFKEKFQEMIFQEEALLLPVLLETFSEEDWLNIAEESDAFGYAMIIPEEKWVQDAAGSKSKAVDHGFDLKKDLPFGGGYLNIEEANLILNNIPLELTFVDKNSIFKYFNTTRDAAEMMLVRTPISIGRNVANCHPPKSLQKVMTIVRDLKTKKRTSESMWYKTDDQYIYITYTALFNETDEFLGILEYVQDIQPFFELPAEVKTGVRKLED